MKEKKICGSNSTHLRVVASARDLLANINIKSLLSICFLIL